MSTPQGPMDFTDAHYIALGKLVVAFQNLEQVITYGIEFIVEENFRANRFLPIVLNELSFASRLKLFSNFIETTPLHYFIPSGVEHEGIRKSEYPEVIEEARKVVELASQAEVSRNQLLHSYWLASPHLYGANDTVIRLKQRTKSDKTLMQEEAISADRIMKTVERMDHAAKLIFKSANHLNVWLRMRKPRSESAGEV